ncbi:MAG: M23 family metallopeptidase [Treponema sp.]|nr:M23 family metallopeptidase [Treponema sp.]
MLSNSPSVASRNTFRLAAFLCIAFLLFPVKFNKEQDSLEIDENGIGGGIFFEEQAEFELLGAVSVEMEPESFSKTRTLLYGSHIVERGDNISTLAINFGLNQDSIISANKISNTRLLQIGRVLKIPNQDGILHTVRSGENLAAISQRYRVDKEEIQTVNELFSEKIVTGTDLFIPGARLEWTRLQEINGDLFIWPVNGPITSHYGYRRDPFNRNRRQFHSGIDIRGATGAPVRAAMAGRVSRVGWDGVWGNYIVINHHSGYRTLYAHLNVIRTRTGAFVTQGERIGDVGSTGLSTGPHLHFTVYKNGVTVNPRVLMR